MSKKSVYEIIKRQNGEKFAKCIRDFDSGIFDVPHLAQIVRYAGKEAKDLLPYLESLKPLYEKDKKVFETTDDVFQLAKKAGYQVIYADTLEKQNQIRHLFFETEELCTFKDPLRYKKYHIFHFIKEGAENLKRFDFAGKESREDAYATSVLSIQILKGRGCIKICNRYNHTVDHPDNTFGSDPDKIVKGLTHAFEKFLGQKIGLFEGKVPDGFVQLNHCLYQYHVESDNVFYSSDYYIKNHEVFFINKNHQMIIDAFLIDFKDKKVKTFHEMGQDTTFFHTEYSLVPLIEEELQSGGILSRRKENDLDVVCLDGRPILKARNGMMTYLHLKTPKKSKNGLFCYHEGIEEIYLDNLEDIGNSYFHQSFFSCSSLKVLSLPKLSRLANDSVLYLPMLERLDLKSVEEVQTGCLNCLGHVREIDLPNCIELFPYTLSKNRMLQVIKLDELRHISDNAIVGNPLLMVIKSPFLKQWGQQILKHNPKVRALIQQGDKNEPIKITSSSVSFQPMDLEHTYG